MKSLLDFLHDTKVQAIGFYIVMMGGGLLVWQGHLPDNDRNRIFDLMFLTATFYYGSSKSGASKDETIASLANSQTPTQTVTNADTVLQTTKP